MIMLGLSQGFPAARLACCHFLFLGGRRTQSIQCLLYRASSFNNKAYIAKVARMIAVTTKPPELASSDHTLLYLTHTFTRTNSRYSQALLTRCSRCVEETANHVDCSDSGCQKSPPTDAQVDHLLTASVLHVSGGRIFLLVTQLSSHQSSNQPCVVP